MSVGRLFAMIVFVLVCVVVPIALIEFVGRNFVIRGGAQYFFRDVDHRIPPYARGGINGHGLRMDRESGAFTADATNVILLGDSFVYGFRLDDHQTLPVRLEALARAEWPEREIQVANFGWISASPLLSLRQLREIGEHYRPDTVLLGLDMTDFHDDLKYERLIARTGVFRALAITPISVWLARKVIASSETLDPLHRLVFGYPGPRFFAMTRPLEESRPWLETSRGYLEEIAHFTRDELNARFVLFVFPRSFQYSDREAQASWEAGEVPDLGPHVHAPFRYFQEIEAELDFPVRPLLSTFERTDVFPTCFDDDQHWNADGVDVAARGILEACRDLDCFAPR